MLYLIKCVSSLLWSFSSFILSFSPPTNKHSFSPIKEVSKQGGKEKVFAKKLQMKAKKFTSK